MRVGQDIVLGTCYGLASVHVTTYYVAAAAAANNNNNNNNNGAPFYHFTSAFPECSLAGF